MKYFTHIILIICILAACSSTKTNVSKPAHLRIFYAIPNAQARVIIQSKKQPGLQQTYQLDDAKPLAYHTYQPGYYLISVKTNGRVILKRTYVFGKDGYYTLVVAGLIADRPAASIIQ